MDISELINQLNQLGEQEKIEAKTGQEIGRSILETVCAFANEPQMGGGYLLLGIQKQHSHHDLAYHVVGVPNSEKLVEDLVSQCRTIFNSPVHVEVDQRLINGKAVMSIFVPEVNLNNKPIYFKNQGLPYGAYRRIGSSDIRCNEDDLLMLYQNRNIEAFDYTALPDASCEDIDSAAVEDYRRERAEIHPNAEELRWSDQELLQSLGCLRLTGNKLIPTVAGIMMFGKQSAIRRLFPSMRVDYIREPGKHWMSDIENRYTAVEIRDSIMNAIRRALSAIIDDLPKAFSLPEGNLQRQDIPVIPTIVIREAVVNALMHRSYRVHQAIQIIRYSNRLEIRSPGYSLIAEEHLGEPGSKSRNPKIAEVLHETRFAEMKGSGIRIMRENMQQAGLSPPLFESNRGKDLFVVSFLFHHFLSDQDLQWLADFKQYQLSDEQARALIFVREVGAIDNSAYRNLNKVDTLAASASLRHLKVIGLLTVKNHGPATYYIPGEAFVEFEDKGHKLESKGRKLEGKGHKVEPKGHKLEGKGHKLELLESTENLPRDVQQLLEQLGKKLTKIKMEEVILMLCNWKEMTAEELSRLLKRERTKLNRVYLSPMVEKGLLVYKYPEMPKHPNQTYRTRKRKEKK